MHPTHTSACICTAIARRGLTAAAARSYITLLNIYTHMRIYIYMYIYIYIYICTHIYTYI